MTTTAVFFPFDLFGSGGTAAGALLLADAVREMLADNRREKVPTRARAYTGQVRLREKHFETLADYQRWRETGRREVQRVLERGDMLLWIAGNHLGVLPVYDELSTRGSDVLVVQFDAHLDVFNLSDCTEELSHGNFLMHCAGPLPPLVNLGQRELLLPAEHVGRYYRSTWPADQIHRDPDAVFGEATRLARSATSVFIDLDCDVFDPAYFPGLEHPQPLGLSPAQVLRFITTVPPEKVIGMALSEFAPARDERDRSLATLLWLVEWLLLRKYEGGKGE